MEDDKPERGISFWNQWNKSVNRKRKMKETETKEKRKKKFLLTGPEKRDRVWVEKKFKK